MFYEAHMGFEYSMGSQLYGYLFTANVKDKSINNKINEFLRERGTIGSKGQYSQNSFALIQRSVRCIIVLNRLLLQLV